MRHSKSWLRRLSGPRIFEAVAAAVLASALVGGVTYVLSSHGSPKPAIDLTDFSVSARPAAAAGDHRATATFLVTNDGKASAYGCAVYYQPVDRFGIPAGTESPTRVGALWGLAPGGEHRSEADVTWMFDKLAAGAWNGPYVDAWTECRSPRVVSNEQFFTIGVDGSTGGVAVDGQQQRSASPTWVRCKASPQTGCTMKRVDLQAAFFYVFTPPQLATAEPRAPSGDDGSVPIPRGAGPDRQTFSWHHPATFLTFNSITDNPQVGDERAFLRVAFPPFSAAESHYKRSLIVAPGDLILLRIYYDNDADSGLNLTATNVRVRVSLPPAPGREVHLAGYLSSDNATPHLVGDSAALLGAHAINVSYVSGSAKLWNAYVRGLRLSDDIVSERGALLGAASADGRVSSGYDSQGWVSLELRVRG